MAELYTAIEFAMEKHAGQTRKAFDVPFICHPLSVLSKVMAATVNPAAHQAAVLHDVVEDTDTTIEEIEATFGPEVSTFVLFMTQDKTIKNYYERRLNAVSKLYKRVDSPRRILDNLDEFVLKISDNVDNIDSFTQMVQRFGPNIGHGFDLNRTIWYLDQLGIVYSMADIKLDNLEVQDLEGHEIRIKAFRHLHNQFNIGFSGLKTAFYGV